MSLRQHSPRSLPFSATAYPVPLRLHQGTHVYHPPSLILLQKSSLSLRRRRCGFQSQLCSTSSEIFQRQLVCALALSASTSQLGAALLPPVPAPKQAGGVIVRASAAKGEGKAATAPKQGKKTASKVEAKAPLAKGPKVPLLRGAKALPAAEREAAERRERRRLRETKRTEQQQEQECQAAAAAAPGGSKPRGAGQAPREAEVRGARRLKQAKGGSDSPHPGAASDAEADIGSRNKAQLETALRRFRSRSARAQDQARGYQSEGGEQSDSWQGSAHRRRNRHQEIRFSPSDTPLLDHVSVSSSPERISFSDSSSAERISSWAYGMDRASALDPTEPLGTAAAAEAEARERQNRPTLERLAAVWSRSPEAAKFCAELESLVAAMAPGDQDYRLRQELIERVWQCIAQSRHCRGATLVAFGSFESDLFARWGDMDLCLLLEDSPSRDRKRRVLESLSSCVIPSGLFHSYERVFHARVPLLIFVDRATSLSCDLSVGNAGGFIKSRVLRWFCSLDPRCKPLIFLVKCWAQAAGINDPKNGTLNSYALCLLVLFHLQTCSPPVLPPFSRVLASVHDANGAVPEEASPERRAAMLAGIQERIEQIRGSGEFGDGATGGLPGAAAAGGRNKSSLGALLASFFSKYAVMADLWAQGLAVRPFAGRWGDPSLPHHIDTNKSYTMIVEDPFDLRENCARSVHDNTVGRIVARFQEAADSLRAPPQPKVVPLLRARLFDWPPASDVPNFVVRKRSRDAARRGPIRAQGPQGRLWNPGQQPERYQAPGRGPQPLRMQPQMALPFPQQQALAPVQYMQQQQQQRALGPVSPQQGSPAWHQLYPPPGFVPLGVVHPRHALAGPNMPLGLAAQVHTTGLAIHNEAALRAARGGPVQHRAVSATVPGWPHPQAYRGQPPHAARPQGEQGVRDRGAGGDGRGAPGEGSWRPPAYTALPHGAPPSPPPPAPPTPEGNSGSATEPVPVPQLHQAQGDQARAHTTPGQAPAEEHQQAPPGGGEGGAKGAAAEPGRFPSEGMPSAPSPSGASGLPGASGTPAGASGVHPEGTNEGAGPGDPREVSRAKRMQQRKKVEEKRRAQTKGRKYEDIVLLKSESTVQASTPAPPSASLPGLAPQSGGHTQGLTQGPGPTQGVSPQAVNHSTGRAGVTIPNGTGSGAGEGPGKAKGSVKKKYEVVGPMVGGTPARVAGGPQGGVQPGTPLAATQAPAGGQSEGLEQVTMQLASLLGVLHGGVPLATPREAPGSGPLGPPQEGRVSETRAQQAPPVTIP